MNIKYTIDYSGSHDLLISLQKQIEKSITVDFYYIWVMNSKSHEFKRWISKLYYTDQWEQYINDEWVAKRFSILLLQQWYFKIWIFKNK